MVTCAQCHAEVPDDSPFADRVPCANCGSILRHYSVHLADTVELSSHFAGQAKRDGVTVGYSESERQGTASSGDIRGDQVEHRIRGVSPQGEQDTMGVARNLVQWLNREQIKWGEPSESSAAHTDAVAEGVGANAGATLKIQVVRAIVDPQIWRELGATGEYTASLSLGQAAQMMWDAVQKKVGKIEPEARQGLVLLLDANRCPGQAFPAVVAEYRRQYADETRRLGFDGVYVAGYLMDSVSALDE